MFTLPSSRRSQPDAADAERVAADARSLAGRASRLMSGVADRPAAARTEPLRSALDALDDAREVLKSTRRALRHLAEPAIAAAAEPDLATRALLADDYDEHRLSIGMLTVEPNDAAAPLLMPRATGITVELGGRLTYRIAAFPGIAAKGGWDLPPPRSGFAEMDDIAGALTAVDSAFTRIDQALAGYRRDSLFLVDRLGELAKSA